MIKLPRIFHTALDLPTKTQWGFKTQWIHLSNWKKRARAPGWLGYLLGMKYYYTTPVFLGGLFHKPWNKDPHFKRNQDSMESRGPRVFFRGSCIGSIVSNAGPPRSAAWKYRNLMDAGSLWGKLTPWNLEENQYLQVVYVEIHVFRL